MPVQLSEACHFAKNWQQQLSEAFTSIEDLCEYLELSLGDLPISSAASKNFALRVPLSFAASIEKGNPGDPLLRQVLPIRDELIDYPNYSHDPVGDLQATVQPGLLHKYRGRVLLINTGSCAINCRYCFRRNFPYGDLQLSKQQESGVIETIKTDPTITEVILSGGDPLLLSDARLVHLIQQLDTLDQVKRIRIHSRLPIVLPARVTDDLIKVLVNCSKQMVLVVHSNHANEINGRVISACNLLKSSGITLLNQSVLLKGINDNIDTLCELSEQLFTLGIIPYYLHLLDKATGTGHFEVSEVEAKVLIKQVQNILPGYLVPKLVKEVAGAEAKQYVLAEMVN
ncbi:EF-P beta-lysylation protein EpmB [Methyloglobulus sp.]|uniref:EF-P beta-lysylation protein EpmB n=1 Tax=Methyloglobulus sp. TaxID=2518622 RepID=UPI00398A2C84